MEITLTEPIEQFIRAQLQRGYADPSEVARQALLRWMEEEEADIDPPRLREKLDEARRGKFAAFDPQRYEQLSPGADATAR